MSPLVDPGRVYYPSGGDEGWGAFGALELSGIAWALGGVSPVDVEPDTPFLRSIVDEDVIAAGVAAWQVPRLVPELNEAWHDAPPADDCPAVRAHLENWIYGPDGRMAG